MAEHTTKAFDALHDQLKVEDSLKPKPKWGTLHEGPVGTSQGLKPACFICTLCLLSFPDLSSLKRHWRSAHNQQLPPRVGHFQRDAHSKDGMFQCKHCSRKLGSWGNLQRHIQQRNCPALWLAEQGVTTLQSIASSRDQVLEPFEPEENRMETFTESLPRTRLLG